jgi:hypothetical protein
MGKTKSAAAARRKREFDKAIGEARQTIAEIHAIGAADPLFAAVNICRGRPRTSDRRCSGSLVSRPCAPRDRRSRGR